MGLFDCSELDSSTSEGRKIQGAGLGVAGGGWGALGDG